MIAALERALRRRNGRLRETLLEELCRQGDMRCLRKKGEITVLAKPRRNSSTVEWLSIVHLFTAFWGVRYFAEFFPKFVDRLQLPDNLKAGDKGITLMP
ncbi:MAG: hypothetical protein WDZ59_01440 [Pirellulales bacterium]